MHIVAALHLHGDVKNIEQLLYLEAIGININAKNTCIAFSPLIWFRWPCVFRQCISKVSIGYFWYFHKFLIINKIYSCTKKSDWQLRFQYQFQQYLSIWSSCAVISQNPTLWLIRLLVTVAIFKSSTLMGKLVFLD